MRPSFSSVLFCPPLAAVITAHQREQLATRHNLSAHVCVCACAEWVMQFIYNPLLALSYLLLAPERGAGTRVSIGEEGWVVGEN